MKKYPRSCDHLATITAGRRGFLVLKALHAAGRLPMPGNCHQGTTFRCNRRTSILKPCTKVNSPGAVFREKVPPAERIGKAASLDMYAAPEVHFATPERSVARSAWPPYLFPDFRKSETQGTRVLSLCHLWHRSCNDNEGVSAVSRARCEGRSMRDCFNEKPRNDHRVHRTASLSLDVPSPC
jgi:hypothetical protein